MPHKKDSVSSRGSVPTIITINNEEGEMVDDKLITMSNGLHKETTSVLSPKTKRSSKKFLDPSTAPQKYSNLELDQNWVSEFTDILCMHISN